VRSYSFTINETKLIFSRIRRKRPSLRLIISSATLDASTFLDYFSSSPPQQFEATVLNIPGRMYPVEIAYLSEPTEDYVKEAVKVVWNLHLQSGGKGGAVEGDVLVFLTGREEIERALYEFSELLPRCIICCIYCLSL
jgi:ATP-dependent RNA helicase DDX35